jgi:hypothetical protein
MPQLGCVHEPPIVRETAIEIFKYETTNCAEIVRILITRKLMAPPPANDVHTALKSAQRKVQRWISSHQDKEKHEYMSVRQEKANAKRVRMAEEAKRAATQVKRVRSKGMSLAERNFMVALLTSNPETPTSTLQFQLSNRFGSNWGYSTIQHNRKQAGFNAKRTSPVNRASDPVTRNQYKTLWKDLDVQLWQCVFM